jgi:DNA-binding MurR/RpiR family transcriptional regulator
MKQMDYYYLDETFVAAAHAVCYRRAMKHLPLATRLKSDFDALSSRFQDAARWMIDHPADVALLTTREQARRAGVSPATMTRLAQHFGLDGYDDVRKLYADAMRRRPEEFRGRARELLDRRDAEGDAALVQDIFSALAQHLHLLSSPAAVERFAAAADRIAGADRVFCLGLRSTFSVAYIFLFHYVRSLFGATSVLVDGAGGTGIDVLRTIGSGDVLLAVTVRPYARQTIKAARYASGRRAKIVAVTDSEVSPLASIADDLLLVGTETPSFFHSMTPAFAAVECLAALVAARQGSDTLKSLARSEAQLAAFDTYVLPGKSSGKT